jgi:hypothetical protein
MILGVRCQAGEPDGTMSKTAALAFSPLSRSPGGAVVLFPRIDPLRANIEEFRGHHDRFVGIRTPRTLILSDTGDGAFGS